MLPFFAKFLGADKQTPSMGPLPLTERYDNDPELHSRVLDGGLNYGAPPWALKIPRLWSPTLRSWGGLESRSMSSSLQNIILPHTVVRYPAGRGGRAIGARYARQGDRLYVPSVYVQAAPIASRR